MSKPIITEFLLLYQLRERLRLVQARIMEREEQERSTCNSDALGDDLRCVLATGALTELRSEAAFLASLTDTERGLPNDPD